MKQLILFFTLACGIPGFGQKQEDVNIKYMLAGYIYAASSVDDTLALGGHGGSNTFPKGIYRGFFPQEKGFFLHIDDDKVVPLNEKYTGYKFYIANKSDSLMWFSASDSRLSVIAEAYIDSKWQPVEYLPQSWCGNSYHRVSLKSGEYWEFVVPKFSGEEKAKIRYALKYGKGYVYSNEVEASINREQLTVKEEYTPNGLMDPYED